MENKYLKTIIMKTFTLLLAMVLVNCNAKKEISTKENNKNEVQKENLNNNKTSNQATIEVLAEGSHGGYDTPKTMVIDNVDTLIEIYGKINAIRRPGFPIPQIDFSKHSIIAVFMGQKSYGGFSTKVVAVKQNDSKETEIYIEETKPTGFATTVICQPFYICKVNKIDTKIVLKKVE